MRTLRARLTVWFAVALAATMLVFGVIIYVAQRRENLAELDDRSRLEADLIAASLAEAFRARGPLVTRDPESGRLTLVPEVASFLEGIPGFVVVVGPGEDVLHLSSDARALPYASLVRLLRGAFALDTGATFGIADLGPPVGEVRYYARRMQDAGSQIAAVLAGAPVTELALRPQHLVITMVLVAPLILLAATLIAYVLAGRALQPVDQVVDEVRAISDGRSLHRRLAPLATGDELARLTNTLNEMLARLERSFSTLRRFTADASHELKTPLTVLRSGLERAITHPNMPPDALAILDETLAEASRMAEMVDALLMLARGDEGRAPLHVEDVDLQELLDEVAETAGILGEQAGVAVEVSGPGTRVVMQADRARIRQLLMNLMTNAIKYTPAGGAVAITCEHQNGNVVLAVRDTGIGIAPGDLPHIFDRFWRADPARSRTGERPGTGLGLAISKWIVEAHGGTIDVQSRSGRGTTFTVTLPVNPNSGES